MKKLLPLLLILLLAGCQSLYPVDDLYVSEHVSPFAYRETEQTTMETKEPELLRSVKCASDIREAIKRMLKHGEDTGTFLLDDYEGNVNSDMKNMYFALRSDAPLYAYALGGEPEYSVKQEGADTILRIRISIQKDVNSIQTRLYKKGTFEEELFGALRQMVSSYTVQVSGYQDMDWYGLLDRFILEHPDQIVEAPSISVYVFPDRGMVRVLELHFDYNTDHNTLLQRRNSTENSLRFILGQLSVQQPEAMVDTLSKYLIPGTGYSDDPNATVYTQVSLTGGSSRTMASVAAYLCRQAGAECEIVVGEREGKPWYWNRIMVNSRWRSFDLHAAALAGDNHPALHPAEEMIGYTWDPALYPEIQEEPVEPSEPEGSGESTEPTEPTEPTDPTDPTEPTAPIVPTDTTETTETTEMTEAPVEDP